MAPFPLSPSGEKARVRGDIITGEVILGCSSNLTQGMSFLVDSMTVRLLRGERMARRAARFRPRSTSGMRGFDGCSEGEDALAPVPLSLQGERHWRSEFVPVGAFPSPARGRGLG